MPRMKAARSGMRDAALPPERWPSRYTVPDCCACVPSGHANQTAAAPLRSMMNSRRIMRGPPTMRMLEYQMSHAALKQLLHRNGGQIADARFGSRTDQVDGLPRLNSWSPPSSTDVSTSQVGTEEVCH